MAEITVEETRLREIVDELVQKRIKSSIDDVEEVRRSPAGTILRLEEHVDAIEKNMATKSDIANLRAEMSDFRSEINERFSTFEKTINERFSTFEITINERVGDVETTLNERTGNIEKTFGEHIGNFEKTLNERTGNIEKTFGEHIGNVEKTLNERVGNVEKTLGERIGKLETGQKIMLTVLFSFFSAIIAMLVKLVFFP